MGLFKKYKFDVDGNAVIVERYERSYVHIPGRKTYLTEKTIYTDGPDFYMVHKGKLTKVAKGTFPPYKLEQKEGKP